MVNESRPRVKLTSFQAGMLFVALLLFTRGIWSFAMGTGRPVLQEVVLVAASLLLGFLYFLLLDYLVHHARVALFVTVALGVLVVWLSPEFATGASLALAYLTYESL
jgi:hypothetical protein